MYQCMAAATKSKGHFRFLNDGLEYRVATLLLACERRAVCVTA